MDSNNNTLPYWDADYRKMENILRRKPSGDQWTEDDHTRCTSMRHVANPPYNCVWISPHLVTQNVLREHSARCSPFCILEFHGRIPDTSAVVMGSGNHQIQVETRVWTDNRVLTSDNARIRYVLLKFPSTADCCHFMGQWNNLVVFNDAENRGQFPPRHITVDMVREIEQNFLASPLRSDGNGHTQALVPSAPRRPSLQTQQHSNVPGPNFTNSLTYANAGHADPAPTPGNLWIDDVYQGPPMPARAIHGYGAIGYNPSGQNGYPDIQQTSISRDAILHGYDTRTTVMLRNLPNRLSYRNFKSWLDSCTPNVYDFVYLRRDFSTDLTVGYAFINLVDPAYILDFLNHTTGIVFPGNPSRKTMALSYANIQGLDSLIDHFQNSAVMGHRNPDARPRLYYTINDGVSYAGIERDFPMPNNIGRYRRSVTRIREEGLYTRASGRLHRSGNLDLGNPNGPSFSQMYVRSRSMTAAELADLLRSNAVLRREVEEDLQLDNITIQLNGTSFAEDEY